MTFGFISADKVIAQYRCHFVRMQLHAGELANSRLETPLFSYDNLRD
jgi:hypothetical protein